MNFIITIVTLSLFLLVMTQAVAFHKATVCRQKAWLKSTELLTKKTLSTPPEKEQLWDFDCKLIVTRKQSEITWRKLSDIQTQEFDVVLGSGL